MKITFKLLQCFLWASLITFAVAPPPLSAAPRPSDAYAQFNLVADEDGIASRTDPELINPWGVIAGPGSVWVNLTETSLLRAYQPAGRPFKSRVNIPGPGDLPGHPTGLVFNETRGFFVSNVRSNGIRREMPATFLIATENGSIAAWNMNVNGSNAVTVVDQSNAGASYTGIAIAMDTNEAPQIYAANFRLGRVDVFDAEFNLIGAFSDPTVPAGFAPFNVRTIRRYLFVTFAKQSPDLSDDEPGPGNGFVDIFDTDGTLLRRFTSQGVLNSPWGMTIAPRNFGKFSGTLLVGNFGDGRINAFDLLTGKWLGALSNADDEPIEIEGLWGLDFDHRENPLNESAFRANRLYFTAGPGDEMHGLLGYIRLMRR